MTPREEAQLIAERVLEQLLDDDPTGIERLPGLVSEAVSDLWEAKVKRLQLLVRLANIQLTTAFAPITTFRSVSDNPELLAEAQEATNEDH